jgi:hypothetical protein
MIYEFGNFMLYATAPKLSVYVFETDSVGAE